MKFLGKFALAIFLSVGVFLGTKNVVLAAPVQCIGQLPGLQLTGSWPATIGLLTPFDPAPFTITNLPAGKQYKAICAMEQGLQYEDMFEISNLSPVPTSGGKGNLTIDFPAGECANVSGISPGNLDPNDPSFGSFVKIESLDGQIPACTLFTYTLVPPQLDLQCNSSNITLSDTNNKQGCFVAGEAINWSVSNIRYSSGALANNVSINTSFENGSSSQSVYPVSGGIVSGSASTDSVDSGKQFRLIIRTQDGSKDLCSRSIEMFSFCSPEDKDKPLTGTGSDFVLCNQAEETDRGKCDACFGAGKLWTAFGCVETTAEGIVTSFLRVGLGIAGGFVLLSILYGAFLLTTSSGDPKRVQEGQEMVSSAIMGLFFVIFSIIILRFIGVSLLQIPGFGA